MTYYPTKIAANELGLTDRRVRQLSEEKLLPAEFIGGIWLIDEDELEIFRAKRVRSRRSRRRK